MKLGIIGADTSHAVEFTRLLNNPSNPHYVSGATINQFYPGSSDDWALSASRVEGYSNELRDHWGLEIAKSPEAVAEQCDAVLLLAVDGRSHPHLLERIAPMRKPVFIDKPFALGTNEAQQMIETAAKHCVPLMSSSAVRFDEGLVACLSDAGAVTGADIHGPMVLEQTQRDLYWYGIHSAEMLFAVMGPGCRHVHATEDDNGCTLVGTWHDGRVGTIRGRYSGKGGFSASIHCADQTEYLRIGQASKPFYASLLERVIPFLRDGLVSVPLSETLEIITFLEKANESRRTNEAVSM